MCGVSWYDVLLMIGHTIFVFFLCVAIVMVCGGLWLHLKDTLSKRKGKK